MDETTLRQRLDDFDAASDQMESRFGDLLHSIGWTQAELLRSHHESKSKKPPSGNSVSKRPAMMTDERSNDFRTRQQKLEDYMLAVDRLGHFTEPELIVSSTTNINAATASQAHSNLATFAEITRQQLREQKRRRQKYRNTKKPPLRLHEELRALIAVQMDAWQAYVQKNKHATQPSCSKSR